MVGATERTQTPITNCDGRLRTSNDDGLRLDVFKHAILKLRCAKRELKDVRKFNLTQKYTECRFAPENQVSIK